MSVDVHHVLSEPILRRICSEYVEMPGQRAYEMFRHRDSWSGGPLVDWLNAEHELVWQPPVKLRQKDDQLEVVAAVAGIDSRDLDVQVTAEDVLLKSEVDHRHAPESGTVHLCEFSRGKMFRAIHLPDKIISHRRFAAPGSSRGRTVIRRVVRLLPRPRWSVSTTLSRPRRTAS
jgi:HSP20 family molecular chaperone IbpA